MKMGAELPVKGYSSDSFGTVPLIIPKFYVKLEILLV